jgi:hypothetical protein
MLAKPFGFQEFLDLGEKFVAHSSRNIHAFACDAIHAITFAPEKTGRATE